MVCCAFLGSARQHQAPAAQRPALKRPGEEIQQPNRASPNGARLHLFRSSGLGEFDRHQPTASRRPRKFGNALWEGGGGVCKFRNFEGGFRLTRLVHLAPQTMILLCVWACWKRRLVAVARSRNGSARPESTVQGSNAMGELGLSARDRYQRGNRRHTCG